MEKELLKEFLEFVLGTGFIKQGSAPNNVVSLFLERHKKKIEEMRLDTNKNLIETLTKRPEQIYKKEQELVDLNEKLTEANIKKRSIEDMVYYVVSSEELDGKKTFSNEPKRKAETERRLKDQTDYKEITDEVVSLSKEIKNLALEIEFLKRHNRNIRVIAQLRVD